MKLYRIIYSFNNYQVSKNLLKYEIFNKKKLHTLKELKLC